jgi:acetyl-CoA synthetase (ADP-forming)
MSIIEEAVRRKATTLSEYDAKKFLAERGIAVTKEIAAQTEQEAVAAAVEIGYPVVLKGVGASLTHKTELGLVALDLRSETELKEAYHKLVANNEVSVEEVLVQEMVAGAREFVVGLTHDANFGPTVMFGVGGIFSEALEDIAFRLAPINHDEAMQMMREIRGHKLLDAIRGKPAVDREALADILVAIGRIGAEVPEIREIDINPLKLRGASPVAVDALVVLASEG